MERRRFLMSSMVLACSSAGLQLLPWRMAVGADGGGPAPTAEQLRRIISSSGGRSGRMYRGQKGGSFRPNVPKGGRINPEGQYLGDLELLNLSTKATVSEQIVLRVVDGKVQMFHLVGDTVLPGRNVSVTRDGMRGSFSIDFNLLDIGPLEVTVNGDGSLTITLDLGPVDITYTTDPPPPSSGGGFGGSPVTYAY